MVPRGRRASRQLALAVRVWEGFIALHPWQRRSVRDAGGCSRALRGGRRMRTSGQTSPPASNPERPELGRGPRMRQASTLASDAEESGRYVPSYIEELTG